jgi:hypothetical protein
MNTKPWYQSKTILGAITAGIPSIVILLKISGVDIADLADSLTASLIGLLGLIGVIVTIIGRFRAWKAPTLTALLAAAFILCGCANLTPNQRSALTQAENIALNTAVNVGLSYATGGTINAAPLIISSIEGGAQIVRSLIGTPAAANPAAVTEAVASGSVSKAVDNKIAPEVGKAVDQAIKAGAKPDAAVEAVATGLDKAAAELKAKTAASGP